MLALSHFKERLLPSLGSVAGAFTEAHSEESVSLSALSSHFLSKTQASRAFGRTAPDHRRRRLGNMTQAGHDLSASLISRRVQVIVFIVNNDFHMLFSFG